MFPYCLLSAISPPRLLYPLLAYHILLYPLVGPSIFSYPLLSSPNASSMLHIFYYFPQTSLGFHILSYPYLDSDSDYLFNINMYKSHNINKGNTVTIQDKFYTIIYMYSVLEIGQRLFSRWRTTTTVRLFQNGFFKCNDTFYKVRFNIFEGFQSLCIHKLSQL